VQQYGTAGALGTTQAAGYCFHFARCNLLSLNGCELGVEPQGAAVGSRSSGMTFGQLAALSTGSPAASGATDRGIPAARGGKWSAVQVARLLRVK
jgi:hypothetical protein